MEKAKGSEYFPKALLTRAGTIRNLLNGHLISIGEHVFYTGPPMSGAGPGPKKRNILHIGKTLQKCIPYYLSDLPFMNALFNAFLWAIVEKAKFNILSNSGPKIKNQRAK